MIQILVILTKSLDILDFDKLFSLKEATKQSNWQS